MTVCFKPRPIVDVETLDVWPSLTQCAMDLGISAPAVYNAILRNGRCSGGHGKCTGKRKLEYLDYYLEAYSSEEKERYSKKTGVFWI